MKQKTINKISASWEPMGRAPIVCPNNVFKMKKMQVEAFKALADKPYAIINAPTASGKTLAICWALAKKLHDSPNKKAIIAVPQTIIAHGFKGFCNSKTSILSFVDQENNLVTDENLQIRWSPVNYLCQNTKESNASQILSFLSRKGNKNDINDRILICSHASLVNAFQSHRKLFTNIIVCIDDAHHIKYSEIVDNDDEEAFVFCNQIGAMISYSLKNIEKNIELFLSTATMFRGDKAEIIPKKHFDRFHSFYYPMDEYLKDCEHLRSFSYDFGMYEDVWGKRLEEGFEGKVGKTIIYLPSVGSKYYSYGTKEKDLLEIYKSLSGSKNPIIKEIDSGLTLVKREGKWVKVVNLVDDSNAGLREKRKKLIIEAHEHDDSSLIDVIITLNMFREGANWKWADRCFILGSKGSLTDMCQIIGRLFRDAPDKKHVEVIQFLPFSFDQIDKDKFRDNLNEYSKVIFATMLLEDIIAPVNVEIPIKSDDGKKVSGISTPPVDYLRKQVKDENKILKIWKEIRNKAFVAQDNGEVNFGTNNKKTKTKFADITKSVLKDNGVKKYHQEIADQIRKRWIRESVKSTKNLNGINLDEVDFDVININPLQFWLTYTSGMCGLDTFRKFREAYDHYCFLPFEQAREFARGLGLKSYTEWKEYCKSDDKHKNIPMAADNVYDEWISWGDFLGTGNIANGKIEYLPIEEAREFVTGLGLKNYTEWKEYCKSSKKPVNIPNAPDLYYSEWISWGDFLGTGVIANSKIEYLPFKEAREFVKKINLKSRKEWEQYCKSGKKPSNIPAYPNQTYKSEWVSEGDFLGSRHFRGNDFLSFEEAREFVRKLGLKNWKDWAEYCKSEDKPANIPNRPASKYKNNGWVDRSDWLGVEPFLSFEEAREFVRKLGLKNWKDWAEYCKSGKKPSSIPSAPYKVYKKQWNGKKDWLGVELIEFLSFEEAREFVRKLGLKNHGEWQEYSKHNRPKNIPAVPSKIYKDKGWKGWGDWLGTNNVSPLKKEFMSYDDSRKWAFSSGIKSKDEWLKFRATHQKPFNIPSNPDRHYKGKGWEGYDHWLAGDETK